ncbi:MAG: hypothetical protein M3P30_05740 [Chloroflexota bacterium]|nr:hypothetical protein [Chloroflexota bacterium]
MPDPTERRPSGPRPPRMPRISDLLDASDEMIQFVDKYQKVWEAEGKAMLSLGEFMGARSESMRYQVELMRMGSGAFRRYSEWSQALLSLRPDTILQSLMRPPERGGRPKPPPAEDPADERR